jgi:uncharacterized protein YyaL (SSP411 family)
LERRKPLTDLTPGPAKNLLHLETSPYLLQHKDNPVHWRPWGPAAMAEARTRNVPILLSIGYAACHWCHVMAHESFEDPKTAAIMIDLFVNVKVDREERPDIDAIYMTALALTGEQGGWPLTMFLTPDGEPFWGGTYFPPVSRYGRPGFRDLLREIARIYDHEQDKVISSKTRLVAGLKRMAQGRSGDMDAAAFSIDNVIGYAKLAVQDTDTHYGGLGHAPKFPQAFVYDLIWRNYLRTQDADLRQAVTNTLTHICQGGIYDHLGGGFSRYAVDDTWLIPHFEKMLYDNALLLDLLAHVYAGSGIELYRRRGIETIDFLLRDMRVDDGLFAASLDADSEGEEGKFYVWSKAEISVLLTDDSEDFCKAYGVTDDGNWEGRSILNRLHVLDEDEHAYAAARAKLFAARAKRIPPGFDDKILADWNGLVIHALARASVILNRPDALLAAKTAFTSILEKMSSGDRLYHSYRAGKLGARAMAEDYANMARAALALHQVTGEGTYLTQAQTWIRVMEAHFLDRENGGYFMTADDADDLIVRTRSATDNAVPSANGTMMQVLAHLYHLTGDGAYEARALLLLHAFAGDFRSARYGLTNLLNGFDLLADPRHIVIIGDPAAADTQMMIDHVLRAGLPNLILDRRLPDEDLSPDHPAFGKSMIDGRATAYICRHGTCSAPVTDINSLHAALSLPINS